MHFQSIKRIKEKNKKMSTDLQEKNSFFLSNYYICSYRFVDAASKSGIKFYISRTVFCNGFINKLYSSFKFSDFYIYLFW